MGRQQKQTHVPSDQQLAIDHAETNPSDPFAYARMANLLRRNLEDREQLAAQNERALSEQAAARKRIAKEADAVMADVLRGMGLEPQPQAKPKRRRRRAKETADAAGH